MTKPKSKAQPLGRSIQKVKNKKRAEPQPYAHLFTAEEESKLQSVTQTNDLNEFFSAAQLADREFTAEKEKLVVLSKQAFPTLIENDPQKEAANQASLKIPRRPKWDKTTTAEVLDKQERESFLEWRRSLARLEEEEQLLLSPFERNIEVWRQLWRTVEKSDIIVQIVDARNPLFFYCQDLVNYVREVDEKKICLLLVNKADLLNEKQRTKWAEYFDKVGLDFLFWSANFEKQKLEEQKSNQDEEEQEEEEGEEGEQEEQQAEQTAVNKTELQRQRTLEEKIKVHTRSELLNYVRQLGKSSIEKQERVVVGMVGYPNVGKSSTINVLVGEKKVNVSSTPGKTKHIQTLFIEKDITLCDCPGLVFPNFVSTKSEMICNGLLSIDQMRDFVGPVSLICRRIPKKILEDTYGIILPKPADHEPADRPPHPEELLQAYGYIRGFMTVHGSPDESRAARIILKDYVNGKLLFCHKPPEETTTTSSSSSSSSSTTSSSSRTSEVFTEDVRNVTNKVKPVKLNQKPTYKTATVEVEIGGQNKGGDGVMAHTKGRRAGQANFTRVSFTHSVAPVASSSSSNRK